MSSASAGSCIWLKFVRSFSNAKTLQPSKYKKSLKYKVDQGDMKPIESFPFLAQVLVALVFPNTLGLI